ncbi:hypothetical protein Ssi03_68340 [Sphaerisporangium siamense]|uniref:Putative membrane protein YdfJ with MMPL/SSD domain n=1 Tax=Sphaerisporangium siamense TaxID=795645 RepID=A0A7W7D8B4_9ACTN|nr:MMPL family transporter [Sphaerisporangium siamense]MBB4700791.1 putative membrane protein YdfJ with MMPL/SSD domain [Sphaerisporangium siamense]GII88844.1 hypothetical protein Ssi03_68340 [Sphaerisporangium siamense]
MLDVIGRLTTRHVLWLLPAWLALLAAVAAGRPETLPDGYGPLPAGVPGAVGAVLVTLALAVVLRSPGAALTAVAAAVAVDCLSSGLVSGLGLPEAPAVFAYGTTLASTAMLLHRFRERRNAGEPAAQAIVTALEQVGGVVATSGAAWMAACAALPLGAFPAGLGPALALTSAVEMLVVLAFVPCLTAALPRLVGWPGRRRRAGRRTVLNRLGRAVAARPRAWTAGAAALIAAMGAAGPLQTREPPPFTVMAVAGVLVALVVALVLRSLIAPVYLTAGGVLIAWAAGTAATRPGEQITVFLFTLVATVSAALLVLARVRGAARTGRDPRTCSALAVKYAGPPAVAALLAAGTLAGGAHEVLAGVYLVAGGAALALVVVPGLAAILGGRAWWPDVASGDGPPPLGPGQARDQGNPRDHGHHGEHRDHEDHGVEDAGELRGLPEEPWGATRREMGEPYDPSLGSGTAAADRRGPGARTRTRPG